MEIYKIKISEQDRQLVSGFMGEEYPLEIDFNWLMPVVEKIENSLKWKYEVEIGNNLYHPVIMYRCTIHDEGNALYLEFEDKEKIKAVWLAVVEFIKGNTKNK